jgi:hypothetical protein
LSDGSRRSPRPALRCRRLALSPVQRGCRTLAERCTARAPREPEPPRPTLARSDHDLPLRPDPRQTRRGRAPIARQVRRIAGGTMRSAEENRTPAAERLSRVRSEGSQEALCAVRRRTEPLRPSAYRASGQKDRRRHYAQCGGEQNPWRTRPLGPLQRLSRPMPPILLPSPSRHRLSHRHRTCPGRSGRRCRD